MSSSVKDCLNKSGLSFVSHFLHLYFLLPSFHTLIFGGYIRVLVPVTMIYLPINLDALVYSLTNLTPSLPRLCPFWSEIANEIFIVYPTRFFVFSLFYAFSFFWWLRLLSASIGRDWLFQGRRIISHTYM